MSTLAVSLDVERMQAEYDRRRQNKQSRDAAKAVLKNFKQQEDDDIADLYTDPDAPGQQKHARVVVILDPVKEGVDAQRPAKAPDIKAPRNIVGYKKVMLTLVASPTGTTLTDDVDAEGKTIKGKKVEAWEMVASDEELAQAALREAIAERRQYGPTDAWVVYGTYLGKRVSMLVVGKLSDLRYYWPDSMTRRRLKRAGVDLAQLGNPLQIRRHGVRHPG